MREWLDTPAGGIGVLGSVVVIVTALLKLGEWTGKLESATKYWEWKGKIDANIDTLSKVVTDEIKADIRDIRDKFTELVGQVGRATAVAGSPRRLTPFGKEVADELRAQAWAEQQAKSNDQLPISDFPVRGMKEALKVLEPFQLDEFARSYVRRTLRKDLALSYRVAECAYEFGIDQERVIEVLQIVLREELLDRQ